MILLFLSLPFFLSLDRGGWRHVDPNGASRGAAHKAPYFTTIIMFRIALFRSGKREHDGMPRRRAARHGHAAA